MKSLVATKKSQAMERPSKMMPMTFCLPRAILTLRGHGVHCTASEEGRDVNVTMMAVAELANSRKP
jgi:hypothetical protein